MGEEVYIEVVLPRRERGIISDKTHRIEYPSVQNKTIDILEGLLGIRDGIS